MRSDPDAVRLITERLGAKEMGPADHIRTKHEVKAFVEKGTESVARTLLHQATARVETGQKLAARQSLNRGQRI